MRAVRGDQRTTRHDGPLPDTGMPDADTLENEKLLRALDQIADSIMITDRRGVIEYVNAGFEMTTGYTRDEVLGKNPNVVKSGQQSEEFYQQLWQTIKQGKIFRDVLVNRKKDGSYYFEEKTITPMRDASGEITHYISSGKDISERIRTEKRLHFLAYHDVLTGLPNRLMLMDRLKMAIARAERSKTRVALLFMDLDRFKLINDTLGHDIGDELLKQLAGRLEQLVRKEDTVSRLSGDEFGFLLQDLDMAAEVGNVAKHLIHEVAKPFCIQDKELLVTGSLGISLYPNDGDDSQQLLKAADIAMYRAKAHGRNGYCFYTPDIDTLSEDRLALEVELRKALDRHEYRLHYQPQVSCKDGRLVGVEALLRWQHPVRGLVSPADFVPLLEETGMIVKVGAWVIDEACRQLAKWRALGVEIQQVAINLAPAQFGDVNMAKHLLASIAAHGLTNADIEVEITESALIYNTGSVRQILQELSGAGLGIALDDFGTGYSSLGYLHRFSISKLKIDRLFIRDIPDDRADCELTQAIISLAASLNLDLVAEGVENDAQMAFLKSRDCPKIQGFLTSRPLDAGALEEFISSYNRG